MSHNPLEDILNNPKIKSISEQAKRQADKLSKSSTSQKLNSYGARYAAMPSGTRLKVAGGVGAAIGAIGIMTNDQKDDVTSSVGVMAVGAGALIAADRLIVDGAGKSLLGKVNAESIQAAKNKVIDVSAKVATSDKWGKVVNGKYAGRAALVGAGLGLLKTITDTDNDNPVSAAFNAGVGAGIGYGATKAVEWLANNDSTQKAITTGLAGLVINKEDADRVATRAEQRGRTGINEVTKTDVETGAKKVTKEETWVRKRRNGLGKLGMVTAIGATAIGVASIMDTQDELKQRTRADRLKAQQEENLVRQRNQQKRTRESMGYGDVNFGQMAIEMFNNSIGHHKMGNAKFQ